MLHWVGGVHVTWGWWCVCYMGLVVCMLHGVGGVYVTCTQNKPNEIQHCIMSIQTYVIRRIIYKAEPQYPTGNVELAVVFT